MKSNRVPNHDKFCDEVTSILRCWALRGKNNPDAHRENNNENLLSH